MRRGKRKSFNSNVRLFFYIVVLVIMVVSVGYSRVFKVFFANPQIGVVNSGESVSTERKEGSVVESGGGGGSIVVSFTPGTPNAVSSEVLNMLEALLRKAKIYIYGAIYNFDYEPIAELLIEKFREGVDVRLVIERNNSNKRAVEMCKEVGIPILEDLNNAYMHDKFFVVDGMYTWTGSTNLTKNCLFYNNNNSVIVLSKEVSENYLAEFTEMFQMKRFGKGSPVNIKYENVKVNNAVVSVYFAPEDGVEKRLVEEIDNARRGICFLAFSFTSGAVAEKLVLARGKGLDVKGVCEKKNAGNPSSKDEYLISRGIEVRYDSNPKAMHEKVFIFDEWTVWTGSYNFSANADRENDENVIIIRSGEIAKAYLQEFNRIFSTATLPRN